MFKNFYLLDLFIAHIFNPTKQFLQLNEYIPLRTIFLRYTS